MRLTSYTDYALRSLMYLGMNRDSLVTIQDIADAQGIAKNHLTKVVNHLSAMGVIDSVRGRNGGLRLGREPSEINIGEIVRNTENDFYIAECFNPENQGCMYSSACVLKGVLKKATNSFLDVLDGVTLETILVQGANPGARKAPRSTTKPLKLHLKPASPEKVG